MGDIADDHRDMMIELMIFDEYEGCYDMYRNCPLCGNKMLTRKGSNGKFRGCSLYPKCTFTETYQQHGKIIRGN